MQKNDGPWFLYRCIGTSQARKHEAAKQISWIWAASVVAFAKFMARGFAMVCVAEKREGNKLLRLLYFLGRTEGRTADGRRLKSSSRVLVIKNPRHCQPKSIAGHQIFARSPTAAAAPPQAWIARRRGTARSVQSICHYNKGYIPLNSR